MLTITGLPAFNDNYIWMLADTETRTCYVVDPGDAAVVETACSKTGLTLAGILITHHHADHTGGLLKLINKRDIPVYGPAKESITGISHPLKEGDKMVICGTEWQIMETPGHTAGHICYFGRPQGMPPVLFCGDTLFSGGCGRLFEGTPIQMLTSLNKLKTLPPDTLIHCAHEYTQSNLAFAAAVEPHNTALAERIQRVAMLRQNNLATVPSSLEEELATNPFLRTATTTVIDAASRHCGHPVTSAEDSFTIIRQWKDNF